MSAVRIELDGEAIEVDAGRDLLSASLFHGVDIPHFCWHDALGSVGACRLCAVKVFYGPDDLAGRIEMACMTPARADMRVETLDPEAAGMRARVIEWLMVNHPHDCAVCEEGGACHLQDMTVMAGHSRRRYRFTKRTHRNQDLGPLLTHEMNRCIACYRCTRFYRHYAGGRDLDVFGAHDRVYFGRYTDGPLESPFAGNLAEICPTGVFNDKAWSADYARKWDMMATPSLCAGCAVGCNSFLAERHGRLRRVQNRYHGAINGYFLCDRGRFGALHVKSAEQLTQPRVKGETAREAPAWNAARKALARGAVGIGSPRASLETNFALRRLVGATRFFAGISDLEARTVQRMVALLAGGPACIASLKDIETADAAIVLGEDLTGTAPRAALALRQTARAPALRLAAEKGVPAWMDTAARVAGEGLKADIALITPLVDALDDIATWTIRRAPGEIAAFGAAVADALEGHPVEDAAGHAIADALAGADAPLVIAGFGQARADIVETAGRIAAALGPKARLALFPTETNSTGLALMATSGLEGAIEALESGAAKTALIAENDLFERTDAALCERLFDAAETVIVLDSQETRTTARADIVLPVAPIAESAGTVVNHEGRAQRFFAALPSKRPAGWRRLSALSQETWDWERLDDVLAVLADELPPFDGAADAAPDAATRTPLGAIARAPWRFSGRTADDRAGRAPEAVPAPDPDSALAFSMEGSHGQLAPPSLRAGYEVDGLHSASAAYRFLQSPRGSLTDGDPGRRILAEHTPAPCEPVQPEIAGEGLVPVFLHDPFTGDELTRSAIPLAERAPAPCVRLHPGDATALGLSEGDLVRLEGAPGPSPVRLDRAMPRGHVGVSAGTMLARGTHRRVRVEAVR